MKGSLDSGAQPTTGGSARPVLTTDSTYCYSRLASTQLNLLALVEHLSKLVSAMARAIWEALTLVATTVIIIIKESDSLAVFNLFLLSQAVSSGAVSCYLFLELVITFCSVYMRFMRLPRDSFGPPSRGLTACGTQEPRQAHHHPGVPGRLR